MNLQQMIEMARTWGGEYGWMLQAFGVVLFTLVVGVIVKHMLNRLADRTRESRNIIDDALFDALTAPVNGLVWIIGVAFAAHIVGRQTDAAIFDAVDTMRDVAVIAMIMWFSLRFVKNYETRYLADKERKGEPVDKTFVAAMGKLIRAAAIITALLIILQSMGINIAGLLAFGGVGGIAVGLAARDIMANVFGGLSVYLDRPFAVGDWIRSPDKEIEGTVEEIGWRRTIIRTFDQRPLYVPNALFTNISVENPSRMHNRRILERIGVRYDDVASVPAILEDIRNYLKENPHIEQSRTLMVNFDTFGPSSLDFFIYVFTKTKVWTEFHMIKEQVLLRIADIIASHDAEIAFPTTTVHVPNEVRLLEEAKAAG
ncbi:MAG TPA: mechanosensitive ion channel family protein [Burkholderiales bacterium]|nr:mechanosensitive ion channel family protein [Burkholderiales bacterium]